MKFILGSFFIIGVPLACMVVLQIARRSENPKRGAGLALLILGGFVVFFTLLSYIPMIIISFNDATISKVDEIFGLFVWFIPGIALLLTGIKVRKLPSKERKE